MASRLPIAVVLLAVLLSYVYNFYVRRTIYVSGLFRSPEKTEVASEDYVVIENTINCEDVHLHEASGLLFAACEDYPGSRLAWFPPLEHFNDPSSTGKMKGKLQVIDPKTFKTQILALEGFSGPFVTHGIDVINDPDKPKGEAVYIFAVNHKPNPGHYRENGDTSAPRSHSVVELFHHVIGSKTAQHIRTIWHPLFTTPNDLFAESPTSFFVTNDHYYTGGFMRTVEDLFPMAKWTNALHVQLQELGSVDGGDSAGVHASIALEKLHNLNGLSHGRSKDDILATGCAGGLLHVGQIRGDDAKLISVTEVVEFPSPIDNPSYFRDPYANSTFDASGIVGSGPTRGIEFFGNKGKEYAIEPIMVSKASPKLGKKGEEGGTAIQDGGNWDVNVIFQDDGHRIRAASSSVLVAIDPKEEGGKRKAWLFVSSYHAASIIAVKIDL